MEGGQTEMRPVEEQEANPAIFSKRKKGRGKGKKKRAVLELEVDFAC